MNILCAIDTPKLQELHNQVKKEIPNYKDFMTYVTVWQSRQFMGNPYYNGTDYPTKRDILKLKKETETSPTDNTESTNIKQNDIKNVEASVLFSSTQRADRVNTILKVFYAITDQLYDIHRREGGKDSYRDYIVNNLKLITNTVKEFFNPENQPSKKRLFKQVYDNFAYLFDNTVPMINYIEGLSIYREEESEETEVKDSWMQRARTTDFHSTLSNKIRKMLLSVDKYDRKGKIEIDDMGVARIMSPAYIIPVLLENLNPSINAEDFFNKLVNLQSRYPWIKGILDKFNLDESLKSQFYHFFNKEFMPYCISFSDRKNPNRFVIKELNQKSSPYFLIRKWATAYEFGQVLSKDSVYSSGSKLNKTKAASNLVKLSALIDSVKNKYDIQDEKQINKLKELLLTVGITVDNTDLKDILNTSTEWGDSNFSYITMALYTIFNNIKNENLSNYKNGILQTNITQEFKKAYRTIANVLSLKSEDTYLRNFKELGATYQSYAAPSYKGIILANLKNPNNEEFTTFLNNEFLYDQIFYTKESGIRNIWLKELAENKSARSILDWRVILHSNRKSFNNWSDQEYMKIIINQFLSDWNNKEKTAWYYIPLLADAESAEFIRFYRYSEEEIIKNMTLVLRQEYDRIMRVRAREVFSVNPITNYDIIYDAKTGEKLGAVKDKDGNIIYSSIGDTFKYFPELNGTGFLETLENKFLNKDPLISEFLYNTMKNLMNIRLFNFVKELDSLGLFENIDRENEKQNSSHFYTPDGDPISLTSLPSILRHFFYNSEFAQTQIMQIFISDPAFFKNPTDFQKRFKGIYAQTLRLNTTSKYGKKNERYIILPDLYIPFGNMEFIKEALNKRVKSGYLTKAEKQNIIDSLSDVSPVTDAQAYRTPESYRAVMDMAGRWSEENEELYNRIKEGTWTYSDFTNLFNIIKPFTFGTTRTPGIEGQSDIRVPIMHKDTEYTLLTSLLISSEATDSPKLKALSDIMSEYGIDVALFESAVKVGIQGVVDIDNMDSYEEVYDRLKNFVDNTDNPRIGEIVHSIPYDYYGIQVETVEHHSDTRALLGTQIKKLILGNIIGSVDIKGKKYTREDIYKEYNKLLSQNMLEDYEELKSELLSIDSLSDIIKKEVSSRPGFSDEIIKASTVVEAPNPVTGVLEKQFFLPLHDPVQFDRIQHLLFGTIKNKIIKQKIKGGSLFQVSSFGFTDKLQIEYDTKKERIKYIPCYIPIWSEDLKELCWNEESKSYDITRIPPEMRYMIGYRIPTEGASSMLPLYVEGFVPDLSGSTIILPADCYTLMGSDNDGDKIYFMAPEYIIKRYDTTAIIKDYDASKEAIQVLDNLLKGKIDESWIEDAPMDFQTYYEQVKHKYEYSRPIIKYLKYNSSVPVSENTKAQRNNRIIDIIFSILTSPEGFQFSVRPQGFNIAKQVAEIIRLLSDVHTEKDFINRLSVNSFDEAVNKLTEMSHKELAKLTEGIRADFLSPVSQINYHSRNANGANMIGVYAVNNSFHAIAQYTDMACTPFVINGIKYSSLHDIRNKNGVYISNLLSTMVGASVDNTKFPILGDLMQNPITAGVSTLMLNTGVEILDMALFLNQPVIKHIVNRLQDSQNMNRETVIKDILKSVKKYVSEDINEEAATLREVMIKELISDKKNKALQLAYGNLFLKLYKTSSDLFLQSAFLKADTQAGTIDSDIAGTYSKQSLITALKTKTENGASNIINPVLPENMETIDMDNINKSKVPFAQASYSLAYEGVQQMLDKWLPQLGRNIQNIIFNEYGFISYSIDGRLSDKDIRSIFNDMYVYLASNEPFFNSYTDSEGNVITGTKNREYYIKKFPVEFFKEIGKNAKLKNNSFLQKFTMKKADSTVPVDRLVFNAGDYTSYQRKYYTKEWESLLLDPQTVNIAMELFKYMHFFGGFGYNNHDTYINNTPVLLRKIVPDYMEMLHNMKSYPFDDSFIHQWIANHRNNRRFVPEYNFNDYKGAWKIKDNIIYINNDSIPPDMILRVEDEQLILRPIIAVRSNNSEIEYYTAINPRIDSGDAVMYGLNNNLPGYKGRVLEYDCNTYMPESVFTEKSEISEPSPEVPVETDNRKIVVHNIKKKKQLSDYNLVYKEDVNGEISC